MDFPIFQVNLKHYSIRDWKNRKQKLVDKLPNGEYTDFLQYRREIEVPPYLDELSDLVSEEIDDFRQTYPVPVIISNAWCERANKGDYHCVHQHGTTGYSAVLYVEFNSAEHEATKFYSPFTEPVNGDLMEYQPIVKEGDLLIFPSSLLHEGPMNKSDHERVIVSFNIMGEGEANAYNAGLQSSHK